MKEQIVRIDSTGSTFDYLEDIIRCRDCKHYKPHTGKYLSRKFKGSDGVCKYHNYTEVYADKDYCCWGKKKEE